MLGTNRSASSLRICVEFGGVILTDGEDDALANFMPLTGSRKSVCDEGFAEHAVGGVGKDFSKLVWTNT